jgi:predicted permease
MRPARALYRLCLLALPREMRHDHGAEMEEIFADRLRVATNEGGRRAALRTWARAVGDVMAAARESRRAAPPVPDAGWTPLQGDTAMTASSPGRLLRALGQDARFAARLLTRDRGFTVTAIATLAICIAANAIIFAVVDAVVLRPLPIAQADRLVSLYNSYPNAGAPRGSNGVPDYYDRLAGMPALEALTLFRRDGVTLASAEGATRIDALRTTPPLVRLLEVNAAMGRLFNDADGEVGRNFVVILSHGTWQREFGGDPAIVGRTIRINARPHEVIGVLPEGLRFIWDDIGMWLPAAFTPEQRGDGARHSNSWRMAGRLAPGATLEQAQAQLDAVNARNDERFPAFRQILKDVGFHSIATGMQEDLVRDVRPTLYLLWGGVLLVLVLGAVNIANLALVRATRRTRELATRQAVGADRRRLRSQLLVESVLLSMAGGVAGLALAWIGLRAALAALRVEDLPRGFEVALGPWQAAVILGLSLVVGLCIGVIPAARVSRLDVVQSLRDEGRSGTASRSTLFIRRVLATAQISLAFVLLVGAGLLLTSFRAVLSLDPGFRPEGVLTAAISLPSTTYGDDAAIRTFQSRLLESVRALPGVQHAGLTDFLPMSGDSNDSVAIPEGYVMKPGESLVSPWTITVTDDYFRAMGIELVAGRFFDTRDRAESAPVVVVDEQLAARFWPGRDPIGRRMYQPGSAEAAVAPPPDVRWLTVVGVVRNVRFNGFDTSTEPIGAYYFPMSQRADGGFVVTVRTPGDPASLAEPLRRAVRALDAELPVFEVNPMSSLVSDALAPRRVPMRLSVIFGGVALLLAAIGVYGVLAYTVSERRREIGIRMALGSTAGEIFRTVVGDGLKLVGAGLAIGFAGAWFAGRAMTSLLYAVQPTDARVALAVAALLAVVAVAATVLPARRATKVNPGVALNG